MAKTQGKSNNVKAFAGKLSGHKKSWKETRTAVGGNDNGAIADALGIGDGGRVAVVARCTGLTLGISKRNTPFANFSFVVVRGPGKGVQLRKYHGIEDSKNGNQTSEERLRAFVADINTIGYPLSDTDFDQLEAELDGICNEIASSRPAVKLTVDYDGEQYLNVYVNEGLDDDEVEDSDEEEEDEGEDEEEEEESPPPKSSRGSSRSPQNSTASKASSKKSQPEPEEDEDDDGLDDEEEDEEEEDEEEEEEAPFVPVKGDEVKWTPPKARKPQVFKVVATSKANETAKLKNDKGTHEGIAWDELEPA